MATRTDDSPLLYQTPASWAAAALADPVKLLNDHAHLEKKAAANALELLSRWPSPAPPEHWEVTLTAIARDEIEHLGAVVRLLHRRGARLSQSHKNPYANQLRQLVRLGQGTEELMDRLMVSALIEVRSAERFELLGPAAAAAGEPELARLYRGLYASEQGHYRVFLDLAKAVAKPRDVQRRWREMCEAEARIIQAQPPGPRMHSGA